MLFLTHSKHRTHSLHILPMCSMFIMCQKKNCVKNTEGVLISKHSTGLSVFK